MTHDEAQRAIYIDFECLMTKPHSTPELLGLLTGDAEVIEQLIVDPHLAPASVANRRCRVADLASAIEDLVQLAERQDRAIVGWSFFDRDVAMRACPAVAGRLASRYRNAIQAARPWRQWLHPHFDIVREDEHAPKHTLDKYARLAQYPHALALATAQPARWIRHTLQQLKTNGGRYRGTTKKTKRDWHTVLEYNRHDCLALRHITLKATRELEAWRAYERTRFCVDDAERQVCFRVGSRSRKVQELLERHGARRFAFITAWNPASVTQPSAENHRRQAELKNELRRLGYKTLPGVGIGDDPAWEPEESLMVLGMSRAKAVALGQKYGQLAIVFGERDAPAELVSSARKR